MNEQMNKDIKWLTKSLGITEKKHETIITNKFDKEYYRNRYVAAMASLSEKTTTIVDLKEQLSVHTRAFNKEEMELIETKNYLKTAHWTIDYLKTQLAEYKHAYKITLTETSQLDNTGNNNNE